MLQPIHDKRFGFRIHGRRRLVQNEHGGIEQDSARYSEAQFLTLRQSSALLAYQSLVLFRKVFDELVNLCHLGSGDDFFQRSLRSAVRDILADGDRKQHRRLKDHGDFPAQGLQLQLADIDAANCDEARLRIVEPGQKTD
jgi:hypothetical protein